MSYNGSGTFQINTTGQPVGTGTVISSSAFNSLTADLATGLSTAITKDGQTTTTARIPFAAGINSTLVTDSSSVSTGSIITAGGVGVAKNLYVGVNANVAGTLGVTGVATFSAAPIYSSLTASSAVATDASKGLVSVTNTGTGNNVLATSPTLVTPILGTPQSGTLTNATGLPLTTGVTGVLPEANGGTGTTTGYYGFKNRIINGAMVIDQRNAGAAVTVNSISVSPYITDRFFCNGVTSDGVFTAQQTTTAPAGFTNSLKFTVTTADASIGATQRYEFAQVIEGFNFADFNFGSANAKTFTLSFWIRASVTGTYGGAFVNEAANRSYVFSYTITAADTWEYKTITVTGDTTGTWTGATNGYGLRVYWSLGEGSTYQTTAGSWTSGFYIAPTGQTNLIATLNATMYITGVQLEKGSTATSFDYRPYGTELALCQRYCPVITASVNANFGNGFMYGSTGGIANIKFPVTTRVPPTGVTASSAGHFKLYWSGSDLTCTAVNFGFATTDYASFDFSVASGATTNAAIMIRSGNASAQLTLTGCEL